MNSDNESGRERNRDRETMREGERGTGREGRKQTADRQRHEQ